MSLLCRTARGVVFVPDRTKWTMDAPAALVPPGRAVFASMKHGKVFACKKLTCGRRMCLVTGL